MLDSGYNDAKEVSGLDEVHRADAIEKAEWEVRLRTGPAW
jgi:hypothetical protein